MGDRISSNQVSPMGDGAGFDVADPATLRIADDAAPVINLEDHTGTGTWLDFYTAEGTFAAPTDNSNGNLIGRVRFRSFLSAAFRLFGEFSFARSGLGTEYRVNMRDGDGNNITHVYVSPDDLEIKVPGANGGATWMALSAISGVLELFSPNGIARVKINNSGVAFNGGTPSIPEIPATPNAQNIADALVALGLCTQAV